MENREELRLSLLDGEWPEFPADHDRVIVRAIVINAEGKYIFVRIRRDDEFGKATLIETSGGGVEPGEELTAAIRRELKEELGAEVEILCKLGVVSDYYNLIRRHNINHYYLCRAVSFGETDRTAQEIDDFHMTAQCLSYEEALREYEDCRCSKLGRLIANREVPVLERAQEFLRYSGIKEAFLCV